MFSYNTLSHAAAPSPELSSQEQREKGLCQGLTEDYISEATYKTHLTYFRSTFARRPRKPRNRPVLF